MNNNALILQAISESEKTCSCVGVRLESAAIRAALKDLMFNFTEEEGTFKSEEGVEWGHDFSPDWTLVSQM